MRRINKIGVQETYMEFNAKAIEVPGPDDAYFPTINEFALTFNGYYRLGSRREVAEVARRWSTSYQECGILPDDLDTLRVCLFFEQRRWRDQMSSPFDNPKVKTYIRALVEKIRQLSGGTLPGPVDPYP